MFILRDSRILTNPQQNQVLGIQEASIPGMLSLEEELGAMQEQKKQPEEQTAKQLAEEPEEQAKEQPEE